MHTPPPPVGAFHCMDDGPARPGMPSPAGYDLDMTSVMVHPNITASRQCTPLKKPFPNITSSPGSDIHACKMSQAGTCNRLLYVLPVTMLARPPCCCTTPAPMNSLLEEAAHKHKESGPTVLLRMDLVCLTKPPCCNLVFELYLPLAAQLHQATGCGCSMFCVASFHATAVLATCSSNLTTADRC